MKKNLLYAEEYQGGSICTMYHIEFIGNVAKAKKWRVLQEKLKIIIRNKSS